MQYLKSNDCDINNSIKYSKQAQTLESQHTNWGLTLSIQPALVTDGEGFCTQLNKVIASSMTSESPAISTASSNHSHLTFYSTVFLLSLKPHSSIIDTIHFSSEVSETLLNIIFVFILALYIVFFDDKCAPIARSHHTVPVTELWQMFSIKPSQPNKLLH